MNMHTAEKIETIVDCFLRNGTLSGAMGSLHVIEPGWFRVVADGLTVIVRTPRRGGWQVTPRKSRPQRRQARRSRKTCNIRELYR